MSPTKQLCFTCLFGWLVCILPLWFPMVRENLNINFGRKQKGIINSLWNIQPPRPLYLIGNKHAQSLHEDRYIYELAGMRMTSLCNCAIKKMNCIVWESQVWRHCRCKKEAQMQIITCQSCLLLETRIDARSFTAHTQCNMLMQICAFGGKRRLNCRLLCMWITCCWKCNLTEKFDSENYLLLIV
jgi:hypothetical protein